MLSYSNYWFFAEHTMFKLEQEIETGRTSSYKCKDNLLYTWFEKFEKKMITALNNESLMRK